jgi:serine/threonine protein kinase/tetratricopeptide (TPR) repeat protein
MPLSLQQMTRLGELLDQSLPLPVEARRAWLDALPGEDAPLVRTLREALLADDPATVLSGPLERPPSMPGLDAAATRAPSRHAGERLGAYELLRLLGMGGMAEVWLARRADGAFERQVALKIPSLQGVPAEMAERFARECRILATLEYPGIARLYDAGVDVSGVPYIAMEYVQGQPLTSWCAARGLDPAGRIRIFLQVLDAVSFAHARNVIHRDLKPSNILVTDQGEVRLLDFGVARLLQAETRAPSLTRSFGRALTPEYASPELLRGEPVDLRSDIYSLGVVLHELLTGHRPTLGELSAPDAGSTLNAPLREALRSALAPLPAERCPTATQFAAQLGAALVPASRLPRAGKAGRWVAAAAGVLLVVAAGWFVQGRDSEPTTASTDGAAASVAQPAAETVPANASTIAVLPFIDLSERRDQSFFSDGLSEELLTLLTRIPNLRVTASASSFSFRDRRNDIPAIGRALNVANILDGSVRRSGNQLRVAVQLVQASTGTVVWTETYDRELKDVFRLQEDVASAVVDALKLRLLAEQHIPPSERTANVAAYEQYLKGLKSRETYTMEGELAAIEAFQSAVRMDPGFARGYAGIALAAATVGGRTVDRKMFELARSNAERAISLAPRLASGYIARAMLRMHADWDFPGARADLDNALAIEPNSLGAQQLLGLYLMITGRMDEALATQQRMVERNPLSAAAWAGLGETHMAARDFTNARKAMIRADELSPQSTEGRQNRALLEAYAGNGAEAVRFAREVTDPHYRDYALAMAAWSAGREAESRAALQRLIDEVPNVFAAQITMIYARQGDRDNMFKWLDRALAVQDPGLLDIQTRPEFDAFKSDARYQRALRQMNLAR